MRKNANGGIRIREARNGDADVPGTNARPHRGRGRLPRRRAPPARELQRPDPGRPRPPPRLPRLLHRRGGAVRRPPLPRAGRALRRGPPGRRGAAGALVPGRSREGPNGNRRGRAARGRGPGRSAGSRGADVRGGPGRPAGPGGPGGGRGPRPAPRRGGPTPPVLAQLRYVGRLLERRPTLAQHRRLLVAAGWLSVLLAQLWFEAGDREAAEASRDAAFRLGRQAGHAELTAWSVEALALWALADGRFSDALDLARSGQDLAPRPARPPSSWPSTKPRPGPASATTPRPPGPATRPPSPAPCSPPWPPDRRARPILRR